MFFVVVFSLFFMCVGVFCVFFFFFSSFCLFVVVVLFLFFLSFFGGVVRLLLCVFPEGGVWRGMRNFFNFILCTSFYIHILCEIMCYFL